MTRSTLCYLLTDASGTHVWRGPGLRRLTDSLDLSSLPTWPTRADARRVAEALHAAINLDVVPAAVRLA